MQSVPRHMFVEEGLGYSAYDDTPLPIGFQQTISQPFVVALMAEAAELSPGDRVLEVGAGSGYQAALLAELDVVVASVTPFGLFVRLSQLQIDGLIHVTSLPRDYYHRDGTGTALTAIHNA